VFIIGIFNNFKKNSQIKKAYNLINEHKYQEALKCYNESLKQTYIILMHGMVKE